MGVRQDMFDHFSRVAPHYRDVRTTDEAPVRYIRDALAGRTRIVGADVGCGTGRYDLLLFRHLPGLRLTCVDLNPEMLAELARHLSDHGVRDFATMTAAAEDLRFPARSLDCVFSFNAVHHFDFPAFLAAADLAVKADGEMFIYTRTPGQNAGSIWGRHFPGFLDKEARLYDIEEIEAWIDRSPGFRLVGVEVYRYSRTAALEALTRQARSRHYSTFSLYAPDEFDAALATFADNVRRNFDDENEVRWQDGNVLVHIGREPGRGRSAE